jgi:hypothetical protein
LPGTVGQVALTEKMDAKMCEDEDADNCKRIVRNWLLDTSGKSDMESYYRCVSSVSDL